MPLYAKKLLRFPLHKAEISQYETQDYDIRITSECIHLIKLNYNYIILVNGPDTAPLWEINSYEAKKLYTAYVHISLLNDWYTIIILCLISHKNFEFRIPISFNSWI